MMNLDAARMPPQHSPAMNLFRPSEADAVQMTELNVRFDGHAYRYGPYSYDVLKDALAYAKLEQGRQGQMTQSDGEVPVWTPPLMPTEDEQIQMDALGITFDGRHYRYQAYRYDRLADALAYARRNA